MLMKHWTTTQSPEEKTSLKCVVCIPHVKTTDKVALPDGDADTDFVLPSLTDMVNMKVIKTAQHKHVSSRPANYKLINEIRGRT